VNGGAPAGKIVAEKDQLVLALGIEAVEQQARFTRPRLFLGARRDPFDLVPVLCVPVLLLDLVCRRRLDRLDQQDGIPPASTRTRKRQVDQPSRKHRIDPGDSTGALDPNPGPRPGRVG
jgi:hypothetical protein